MHIWLDPLPPKTYISNYQLRSETNRDKNNKLPLWQLNLSPQILPSKIRKFSIGPFFPWCRLLSPRWIIWALFIILVLAGLLFRQYIWSILTPRKSLKQKLFLGLGFPSFLLGCFWFWEFLWFLHFLTVLKYLLRVLLKGQDWVQHLNSGKAFEFRFTFSAKAWKWIL